MEEEMKKLNGEQLEKTNGGTAAAYRGLQQDLKAMIPEEVQEKLKTVTGNVAVCKTLAENGIDVEKIEKKISAAGFDQIKIGLQELSTDELDMVTGGYYGDRVNEFVCRCGNRNKDEMSWQFWSSMIQELVGSYYRRTWRCKKCGTYITATEDGRYHRWNEDDLESYK
jgi:hypothetical protein